MKFLFYSKMYFILIFISFEVLIVSCQEKITKVELTKKNPVDFVFEISKDSVYELITTKLNMHILLMTVKNKRIIPPQVFDKLSQPGNASDIFLWSIGTYCKSRIYKNDKNFLDYWVSFYLHLESIDHNKTKISITAIGPKIILGKELLPSPPHFVRRDKTITVESSTIEEYEILLKIGKLVGEKDMPPLHLHD